MGQKNYVLAHMFIAAITNDSEGSLEKETRGSLTIFHCLYFSRVYITLSPCEEDCRWDGICSHTSSIKVLSLQFQMLLHSPISVYTIKFQCVPSFSLYFLNKWVWHNNVLLGNVCSHSNDMRFAGIC